MILVDTSVWVDHLRRCDSALARLLDNSQVLAHPFVIGELALGHLKQRETILNALQDLPHANIGSREEVLTFIGQQALFKFGIGYVDAHLLAATRLTPGAQIWTRDKQLAAAADWLSLSATPA